MTQIVNGHFYEIIDTGEDEGFMLRYQMRRKERYCLSNVLEQHAWSKKPENLVQALRQADAFHLQQLDYMEDAA